MTKWRGQSEKRGRRKNFFLVAKILGNSTTPPMNTSTQILWNHLPRPSHFIKTFPITPHIYVIYYLLQQSWKYSWTTIQYGHLVWSLSWLKCSQYSNNMKINNVNMMDISNSTALFWNWYMQWMKDTYIFHLLLVRTQVEKTHEPRHEPLSNMDIQHEATPKSYVHNTFTMCKLWLFV